MKNELTRVQKDRSTKRKSDMKNEFDILNLSLTNKTCTKLKFIFCFLKIVGWTGKEHYTCMKYEV